MATISTNAPTLLERFTYWERRTPDATHLTQPYTQQGGDGSVVNYSWREVGDQARRMASHLQSLNLPPRSHIALLGLNSAHWVMADLAIWMAGHVTVPLYSTLNGRTAGYILEHSEAKLLFLGKMDADSPAWKGIAQGIPNNIPIIGLPLCPRSDVPMWDSLIAHTPPLQEIAQPCGHELATIIYTSGSTGNPKGVMHSFNAMAIAADVIGGPRELTSQDRMLSYLPLAHGAERIIVESTSFVYGIQLFFHGDLASFQEDLKRARPTFFFSVPRLWTKFYLGVQEKLPERRQKILFKLPLISRITKKKILEELGLDQVRIAITGSAPLAPHIVEWYRNLGMELLDCYGMSENFAISHASQPGQVRIGYVGSPQPGVQHRLGDHNELQVKSPAQMMGYYKEPELTAQSYTPDGYFKTGDRAEIDTQGRVRITGRIKELFKTTKGKYVAPVPIENKLSQHPGVECVCLTGMGQPQPFALLMLSPETRKAALQDSVRHDSVTKELEALLTETNDMLEEHEHLEYLVIVKEPWTMDNGFLTPTMKLRRNIVEEQYLPNADHWRSTHKRVIWE